MTDLSLHMKLSLSFFLSAIAGAVLAMAEYYTQTLFENRVFMMLIFSTFICDVVLGAWKHLKLHDFSFKELLTKALKKIVITLIAMILFNSLAGAEGIGDTGMKLWFLLVGKLISLFYIAGSAFNSMYIITDHKFPPYAWIKRMKDFNKTLDPKEFSNKKDDEENPTNTI